MFTQLYNFTAALPKRIAPLLVETLALSALLFTVGTSAAVASDTPVNVNVRIKVLDGNDLVELVQFLTLDGMPTSMTRETHGDYIATVVKEGDKVAVTRRPVATGFTIALTATLLVKRYLCSDSVLNRAIRPVPLPGRST